MKINSWIIYWSKHSHVLILINISFKSIFSLRIMWIKCFSSIPFRKTSLRERVQIRSFFLPVFSCIQSGQISVFSLNTGKYGPEKLRIWTLFTQCLFQWILLILIWLLFELLISTLLFACYIFWVRREFILRKVSDNNVIFSYDWALLHLTQFHAYYSLILLLFWRIVLSNIILIFFLEYLLLCYILVYREY